MVKRIALAIMLIFLIIPYTIIFVFGITTAQQSPFKTTAIVRSMIRLRNGQILFVAPVYVAIPDYQEWGIIYPNGTIRDYTGHLIHNHVINFVTITSNGTVLATAKPETSNFPAGPMALFKYDERNNQWILLTEYQGPYHRLDPLTIVTYGGDYIVSGVLETHPHSKWYAFVLRLTPNGKPVWIHVFKDVDAGKGAVKLMRNNNMIFLLLAGTNVTSSSHVVRIYRVDPDTGKLSIMINVPENIIPFTIKDSTGMNHDTFGLFNKDTNVLSIYVPPKNCYINYTLPVGIKTGPWEAEYDNGVVYLSFIGTDDKIYYMIADQASGKIYIVDTSLNVKQLTGPIEIMHTDNIVVIAACYLSSLSSFIFIEHPNNPINTVNAVSNCNVCTPKTVTTTVTTGLASYELIAGLIIAFIAGLAIGLIKKK